MEFNALVFALVREHREGETGPWSPPSYPRRAGVLPWLLNWGIELFRPNLLSCRKGVDLLCFTLDFQYREHNLTTAGGSGALTGS